MELMVNGLPVTVAYDEEDVAHVLRPLARRVADVGEGLVLVAGPPGSGKSTLAQVLASLAAERGASVQALGMDGFHRSNAWLADHGLSQRKGAPETFDFSALEAALERRDRWPRYSRKVHEVDGDDAVVGSVLVVEGNYLLSDEEPWARLKGRADLTVYLGAPEKLLRERVVARKVAGGIAPEDAERHWCETDGPNARFVERTRRPADVDLAWNDDGRLRAMHGL